MSVDTHLPLTLYKANLALWLRTAALLQEGRQRWLERGTQAVSEHIDETRAETAQLLESHDWQALAGLPGHAAWRLLNRQASDLQAITQTAIASQTNFASGLQRALAAWQQESAQALSLAGDAMPIHTSLRELVQNWNHLPVAEGEKATQDSGQSARMSAEAAAPRKSTTRSKS